MAWERYEMNVDDLTRFYDKVDKTEDCWIWNGTRDKDGYGNFWLIDKMVKAHKVSWEIHFGPIDKGTKVLHRCDNTSCVNPTPRRQGSIAYKKVNDNKSPSTCNE